MASKLSKGRKGLGLGGAAALAVAAGRRSAEADLKVEDDNFRRENAARLLSLDMVKERPGEDTRPVDLEHVESLIASIKLIGLIQPIYLDRDFHLVAGAHRLTAFRKLQKEDPQKWSKIPVVVDPDLDSVTQPQEALLKEIAENEKRSNLTPAQVQQAAERLLASDSSFTRKPGRLKKGEKALTPFLANTFGVSTRYVRALLNEGQDPKSIKDSGSKRGKNKASLDPEKQRLKLKKKMAKQTSIWLNDPLLSEEHKLCTQLEKLLKTLQ